MNQEKTPLETGASPETNIAEKLPETPAVVAGAVRETEPHVKPAEAPPPENLPVSNKESIDIDVDSEIKKPLGEHERRPGEPGEMFRVGGKNLETLKQLKKNIVHAPPSSSKPVPSSDISSAKESTEKPNTIQEKIVHEQAKKPGLVSAYATEEKVKLHMAGGKRPQQFFYGESSAPKRLDAYPPRETVSGEINTEAMPVKEEKKTPARHFQPHDAGRLARSITETDEKITSFEAPSKSVKEVEDKIAEARNLLKHVIDAGGSDVMAVAERSLAGVLEKLRKEKEHLERLEEEQRRKKEAERKAEEKAERDRKNILKAKEEEGKKRVGPEPSIHIGDDDIEKITEPPVGNGEAISAELNPEKIATMKERIKILTGGGLPVNWDAEWKKLSREAAQSVLDNTYLDTGSAAAYLQKYLEEIEKTGTSPLEKVGADSHTETVDEYIGRAAEK